MQKSAAEALWNNSKRHHFRTFARMETLVILLGRSKACKSGSHFRNGWLRIFVLPGPLFLAEA
jgi:hypothetical protein